MLEGTGQNSKTGRPELRRMPLLGDILCLPLAPKQRRGKMEKPARMTTTAIKVSVDIARSRVRKRQDGKVGRHGL